MMTLSACTPDIQVLDQGGLLQGRFHPPFRPQGHPSVSPHQSRWGPGVDFANPCTLWGYSTSTPCIVEDLCHIPAGKQPLRVLEHFRLLLETCSAEEASSQLPEPGSVSPNTLPGTNGIGSPGSHHNPPARISPDCFAPDARPTAANRRGISLFTASERSILSDLDPNCPLPSRCFASVLDLTRPGCSSSKTYPPQRCPPSTSRWTFER